MISLTETATARLVELCIQNNSPSLRLSIETGGCAGYRYNWSLDSRSPGDFIVHIEEHSLLISRTDLVYLRGSLIDYIDDRYNARWSIENPIAERCGCGESITCGDMKNG